MSARMAFKPTEYTPKGKYVRLLVNGGIMMSDTRWERITNAAVLSNAHGHVLIGGLGIGMVVFAILGIKPRSLVKSVTIVEKNPDVFDLVTPHLPKDKRLKVVLGDIFTWQPELPKGEKFNCIYFDIWPNLDASKNLPEMATLHRRYSRYLDKDDPKRFMDSWERGHLREERRQWQERGLW